MHIGDRLGVAAVMAEEIGDGAGVSRIVEAWCLVTVVNAFTG